MTFNTLAAFLTWVAVGGGSMVLAGYTVSYLLENIVAWHNLPLWLKTVTPIVLAGIFGTIAQSLLATDIPALIPPVVTVVLLAALNWLASQKAYRSIKDSSYAIQAHALANDELDTLEIVDDDEPIE